MNEVLYHAAPALARDLGPRLAELLSGLPPEEATRLKQMLIVDAHERPRMVFTGQYSSGKSTLIEALTRGEHHVAIGSAVTTDDVTVFDWDGLVDLVDTPGVQTDHPGHDERAEQALRAADLVLFTVTAELFDDRLIDHLRHVTEDLRKAPQLLVIVTKCRTLPEAPGMREAAVRDALGSYADQVPWTQCDAKTYLDGLQEPDPARAQRRIAASRMDEVTTAINRLARERGDLARFRVPLQQIALVAGEALAALTEDPNEKAVLAVLARQRSALTNRRGLLDSALERTATEFRTACIQAADRFADTVESIEESQNPDWSRMTPAVSDLNDELDRATEKFADAVRIVLSSQLADLTSEVREIEASPYARQLVNLYVGGEFETQNTAIRPGHLTTPGRRQSGPPPWAPQLLDHLKDFRRLWGAGDGIKNAAGSPGHKIVYNAGKALGKKFKPWQAVRLADNIGRAAKAGGAVLNVALEAYAVFNDERQEERAVKEKARRRNVLVGQVLARCDEIATSVLTEVRRDIDTQFGQAISAIDQTNQAVREASTSRTRLHSDIAEIQVAAEHMLDQLGLPALEG